MQSALENSKDLHAEAEGLIEEVLNNAAGRLKANPQPWAKRERSAVVYKTVTTTVKCCQHKHSLSAHPCYGKLCPPHASIPQEVHYGSVSPCRCAH